MMDMFIANGLQEVNLATGILNWNQQNGFRAKKNHQVKRLSKMTPQAIAKWMLEELESVKFLYQEAF